MASPADMGAERTSEKDGRKPTDDCQAISESAGPAPTNSSSFMVCMTILAGLVTLFAVEYAGGMGESGLINSDMVDLPAQSVLVDPLSFAVLGANGSFRNASELFNPTGTAPPFFQIISRDFLDVLGSNPSIQLIAENETFAFAHEAPIWIPTTNEVFFASNDGGPLGMSDLEHNSQVSKINLSDPAIANGGTVNYTKVPLSDDVQMDNGGTPFRGQNLLTTSGRGALPPSLVLVNPFPPYNSTVLLDNFFGRQFNSLNDVKIHPRSGKVFFTDVTYGFLNQFRPAPQLPNQVYRFDPDTGSLRVVADGFDRCNGIAFNGDGTIAYVTDTGANAGSLLGNNQTEPATIYAFDVDARNQAFTNRRVFAYVDNGIPDGIQVDSVGRVFSGTGDGVQVWNADGELLGKFFLGTTSANMAFAGPGRLVIMAETAVYLASIAATGLPLENF